MLMRCPGLPSALEMPSGRAARPPTKGNLRGRAGESDRTPRQRPAEVRWLRHHHSVDQMDDPIAGRDVGCENLCSINGDHAAGDFDVEFFAIQRFHFS